jgi:hypothetical protein
VRYIFLTSVFVPVLATGAMAHDWPQAGVSALDAICHQQPRTDVPAKYQAAYCACQTGRVPAAVSWADYLAADQEIRAVGLANISSKAKNTMIDMLLIGNGCFNEVVPQH